MVQVDDLVALTVSLQTGYEVAGTGRQVTRSESHLQAVIKIKHSRAGLPKNCASILSSRGTRLARGYPKRVSI